MYYNDQLDMWHHYLHSAHGDSVATTWQVVWILTIVDDLMITIYLFFISTYNISVKS